ncbi:efflux transporter, RND family, MFP subunit [Candidatus Magnetobacterium bavaricum]|uniref:Efflux transporter, RND family, MFP subunit n=1 Tax=Candidatus Magnetobacterium bavaricum TaxID=29290 RepID=A0A0F3GQE8_9BACT|nr:efflux transporter, RND family, MFP subunit [Candidatus Magnetobacterium bavaricum]
MTANVSIIISKKRDILKIPNAALRFKPVDKRKPPGDQKPAQKKGSGVWINEGNKPKLIAITTGISDGAYTELLKGDLAEGQELIVESLEKHKTSPMSGGPRMF